MSKYLKISSFILILFVIYAPSCVDEQAITEREKAALNETRNGIKTEFETDYLSETTLIAYEETAKQKLSDFVDYLNVLTDNELDKSFRTKAGEMIKSSFISEDMTLQLALQKDYSSGTLNVQQLIKIGLKNKLSIPSFSIDSIVVDKSFRRTGNETYAGTLKFTQMFTAYPNPNNIAGKTTDIYIIKDEKIFGADTLSVWNVRLGEIR